MSKTIIIILGTFCFACGLIFGVLLTAAMAGEGLSDCLDSQNRITQGLSECAVKVREQQSHQSELEEAYTEASYTCLARLKACGWTAEMEDKYVESQKQ